MYFLILKALVCVLSGLSFKFHLLNQLEVVSHDTCKSVIESIKSVFCVKMSVSSCKNLLILCSRTSLMFDATGSRFLNCIKIELFLLSVFSKLFRLILSFVNLLV